MQHERYPSSASVCVTGFAARSDSSGVGACCGDGDLGCRCAQPLANGLNPDGIKTT